MRTRSQNRWLCISLSLFLLLSLVACSRVAGGQEDAQTIADQAFTQPSSIELSIEDEEVPLSGSPAIVLAMPQATGSAVQKNDKAIIDYSNSSDGYIMVQYTASTTKKLKAQVKGPSGVTYTYNVTPGRYETLPLSDGSGSYKVTVFENVSGTSYATVVSTSLTATLKNEFSPFLMPNQYVNYTPQSKVVAEAARVTANASTPLEKVSSVYNYVVTNFTYDTQKAQTVQSGYLPDLDAVLAAKKGICFDYASVMTAMLRSQDVPTKLVVGYSKNIYHAWINVYTPESGWIEGAIFFDGKQWKLMDPTFASSAKQSKAIMDYIGNGANYTAKYLY